MTSHLIQLEEPGEPRPLEGVRVLELASYLPGPFCGRLLADLGAEVIKVEEPGSGDPARWVSQLIGGQSAFFTLLNHGKKGLTLNLKDATGLEIFSQLVALSDVILEGYRPGVAHRLGIDYERLVEFRPGLVYCSMTGYGQSGSAAQRAGHDLNYLARSGILGLTTDASGYPVIPGIQLADLVGGIYGATAILAALRLRDRTGEGRHCDLSLFRGMLSLLAAPVALALEKGPPALGAKLPLSGKLACYNVYRASDGGFLSLSALEPKFWERFCHLLDQAEWTNWQFEETRQTELKEQITLLFARRSRPEWVDFFAGEEVCLEPVLSLGEVLGSVFASPPAGAEGLDDLTRAASVIHFPVDWSSSGEETPAEEEQPRSLRGPDLGADDELLLGLLGYSREEIIDFRARGIIRNVKRAT